MNSKFTNLFCIFILLYAINSTAQTNCTFTKPERNSCDNLVGYTKLTSNNTQIATKYYFSSNNTSTLPSGEVKGNGVLILCGGTINGLENLNINGGTIIIAPGTTVEHASSLYISGTLYNYGTLIVSGTLSVQGSDGLIVNNESGKIHATTFEVNKRCINNGLISLTDRLDIKGSGKICAGSGSAIQAKSVYNDGQNSIIAVSGQNCISFNTSFGGNQPISSSSNTWLCQSGNNNPTNHVIGGASVMNNCTSCAIPLNNEVIEFSAIQIENQIEITWFLDIANEDLIYVLEVAYNDGLFFEVDRKENIRGKEHFTTTINIENTGNLYYRIVKIKKDNLKEVVAMNLLKTKTVNQFKIYPNPVCNSETPKIHIPTEIKENLTLEVYDLVGNMILTNQLIDRDSIDLNQLQQGNYLIIVRDQLGDKLYQEKLVVF